MPDDLPYLTRLFILKVFVLTLAAHVGLLLPEFTQGAFRI